MCDCHLDVTLTGVWFLLAFISDYQQDDDFAHNKHR
jgi:hypothetical protein